MDDSRRSRRRRVLKEGKLVLNAGCSLIDCCIRDRSETGARVRVPAATALPDRLGLIFVTEAIIYQAEVRWRHGNDVGLAFLGEPRRAPPRK